MEKEFSSYLKGPLGGSWAPMKTLGILKEIFMGRAKNYSHIMHAIFRRAK